MFCAESLRPTGQDCPQEAAIMTALASPPAPINGQPPARVFSDPLPHQTPRGTEGRYSLARAVRRLTDPHNKRGLDGLEGEVSQEIARRAGRPIVGNAFHVPWDAEIGVPVSVRASGLNITTGVGAIRTIRLSVIDALRAKTVCGLLGAVYVLDLPYGKVTYPLKSSVSTIAWVAEDAAPPSSNPSILSVITYYPHQGSGFTDVSRPIQSQTTDALEIAISDLVTGFAVEVDRIALAGDGTGANPTGLLSDASVPVYALGPNGAVAQRTDLIAMEKQLGNNNGDAAASASLGWVTTPNARAKLRLTDVNGAAGTSGRFVWTNEPGEELLGKPAYATNQIPSNLTKGTGTALSGLIYGNFADLQIGLWPPTLLVDPFTLSATGATRIVFSCEADSHPRQGNSFVVARDLVTV
jgi:HK97 family phage major capsid protein